MTSPVAIRSLMCKDHALHIQHSTQFVLWHLGKRCNYDCSYCSIHTHDAVSPFIDQTLAKKFASKLLLSASVNNKKINWAFTGGEPFIDPGFVPLLQLIRSHDSVGQINVTTNGSLPLSVYNSVKDMLTGITVSLHLERTDKEVDDTIKKIIELANNSNTFINVNLMFLPGRQQQVENIIQLFKQHNINFILRRIIQHDIDNVLNKSGINTGPGKKDYQLFNIDLQRRYKEQWKIQNFGHTFDQRNLNAYTESELELFKENKRKSLWVNAGVWYADGSYREVNTDSLTSKLENRFRGWTCFAGVDQLYVDFDGSIYVGTCQSGGKIGHISDENISFLASPQHCQVNVCMCNTDIPVRKAANGYEKLITSSNE